MTSLLRVAFNAAFLARPHTGSGQYSRLLLPALHEVAPEVEVALLGTPRDGGLGALAPRPDTRGENVRKVAWEQLIVPLLAARQRYALLHVPYWAPPLVSPVPVVTTIHDVIPALLPEYRGGRAIRAYTWLVSRATRVARRVIVDSE